MFRMCLLLSLAVGADGPDPSLIEGKSIREWIVLSEKGSQDEKKQALKLLHSRLKGAAGVSALKSLCKDKDEVVRSDAVNLMIYVMLHDEDDLVRGEVVYSFRTIALDNTTVTEALLKVITSDKDRFVRCVARGSLSARDLPAREAAPVLLSHLINEKGDPQIRAEVAGLVPLMVSCKEAFLPLIAATKSKNEVVAEAASRALSHLGPEAIKPLAEHLEDPDPLVRASVVWALGSLRTPENKGLEEEDQEAVLKLVPKIRTLLSKDRSGEVRCMAALALGDLRDDSSETVSVLNDALIDKDPKVVRYALIAFRSLIGKAAPDLPRVIKCASSEDVSVRCRSLQVIGWMGDAAIPAIPTVIRALSDKEVYVRRDAIKALGYIGHDRKDVLEALKPLLKDEDESVRHDAKATIEKLLKPSDK